VQTLMVCGYINELCSIIMKNLFILIFLFLMNLAEAQIFLDKLYDTNCPTPDSSWAIDSDFYSVTLHVPKGWNGEFEGELPRLELRKKMGTKIYIMRLYGTYDATGIFGWAQEHFDPNSFEIVTIKGTSVLIELQGDRQNYRVLFYQDPGTEDLWMWSLEVYGAIGNEDLIKCDLTFLLEQLIEE